MDVHCKLKLKKQTIVFLVLNFGTTYLLNIYMLLRFGPYNLQSAKWTFALQFQMLIPALTAIICLLVFKDTSFRGKVKFFLVYFVLYGAAALLIELFNIREAKGIREVFMFFSFLGPVLVIILNMKKSWRQELETARLSFGENSKCYILFPLLMSGIFFVSSLLNRVLGFGSPIETIGAGSFLIETLKSVVILPVIAPLLYFGEEYGWRVYLQDRLIRLFGKFKGVLLLGIIWGLWHAPVIAMGYNYPGYPVLGIFIMVIFSMVIGIYLSLAVFKTKSIWIAVILHAGINNYAPVLYRYVAYPKDFVFSFGLGLYGIIILGLIAVYLLRSPEWKQSETIIHS